MRPAFRTTCGGGGASCATVEAPSPTSSSYNKQRRPLLLPLQSQLNNGSSSSSSNNDNKSNSHLINPNQKWRRRWFVRRSVACWKNMSLSRGEDFNGCCYVVSQTNNSLNSQTQRRRSKVAPTIPSSILRMTRLVLLGFLSFVAFHRCLSFSMRNQRWVHAPIHTIYRQCPRPDYPTLSDVANTTTSTTVSTNRQLKSEQTKPNICLTTLTDETKKSTAMQFLAWRNFDGLLKLTWQNKQLYCDKHGYRLYDESEMLDTSRPPSWSKIRAVRRLLTDPNENCDWVFWLDADTVIMNSSIALTDFLPLNNATQDLLLSADNYGGYNAGSWIIRKSDWSIRFLDEWWSMTSYIQPIGLAKSGDNDALKAKTAAMDEAYFDQHILAPPRCTFNSFSKFLRPHEQRNLLLEQTNALLESQEWYMDTAHYHRSDFIAHVAGVDNKQETIAMLLKMAR